MSSDCTVIGPQWTNHSARMRVNDQWYSTDYIQNDELTDQCPGDLFLFSKTSTTDSPGYVLLDYDIEFKNLQLNIKNSIYPIARIPWHQTCLGSASAARTANTSRLVWGAVGNDYAGTAALLPTGFTIGDIYKIFIDMGNSSYTNATGANLISYNDSLGNAVPVTLQDGYTFYGIADTSTTMDFSPTFAGAMARSFYAYYGVTATVAPLMQVWMTLVGNNTGTVAQSNI